MELKSTLESPEQAIDHVKFQWDLLKLTSMQMELTGPSIMQEQQTEAEAVRVLQALQTTASKIQDR
jgi:hypothetical protein